MGEKGEDFIFIGTGKPDREKKAFGRRSFLKVAAIAGAGAVLTACKPDAGKTEAEGAELLAKAIGRKENPHPEYGHLVWSTFIAVKEGAKLRSAPTIETPQQTEWLFTQPVGGNDPIIRELQPDEIWLIENPLFTAQESVGIRPATVTPLEGTPYDIELRSVWFAVHTNESPNGIGWFWIDDVHFLDDNKQVQWEPPVASIIQTKINGPEPWNGTAMLGNGISLQIGKVTTKAAR